MFFLCFTRYVVINDDNIAANERIRTAIIIQCTAAEFPKLFPPVPSEMNGKMRGGRRTKNTTMTVMSLSLCFLMPRDIYFTE